jgi:hypothetical protein
VLYLTPERFRTMGFGVDLDDVEDMTLRSILTRASAKVDSFCAVPTRPVPFSFLGGTIVGEEHGYDVGGHWQAPQRRFFPRHSPVLSCSAVRIQVTNNHYINMTGTELFTTARTVDIVSIGLTANSIFGVSISPVIGLHPPVAYIDYTYGRAIPEVDEVLEPTDAKLYRAQHQFWTAATVEVKANGTVVAAGDYTVDRTEGTITFGTGRTAGDVITASYTHKLPGEIQMGTAIIAADDIGQNELRAKGLGGLRSLKVGEISMDREGQRRSLETTQQVGEVPAEAAQLLVGYRFISLR